MHKRPENGMWLPTGRQLETVIYVFPPGHKDNEKTKVDRETYKLYYFVFTKLHSSPFKPWEPNDRLLVSIVIIVEQLCARLYVFRGQDDKVESATN